MPQPVRTARLLILLVASLGTLLLATIVASAFSSTAFKDLRTPELVGLVALLTLPAATGLAVISEQRARAGQ